MTKTNTPSTPRTITIVGGGQAGLQLALGLLKNGYEVTVVSSESADDVRNGTIRSTQCLFATSLDCERALGLNLWEDQCPSIHGVRLSIAGENGRPALQWAGTFERYAQSIDQRVKYPVWMELVEELGGRLDIRSVSTEDLDELAAACDLLVVAAGKRAFGDLFPPDAARSPCDRPQRSLAVCYVTGLESQEPKRVAFNVVPGVGEYFVFAGLTHSGEYHNMFFEGLPGGPFDCFDQLAAPDDRLQQMLALLKQHIPWEFERCRDVELADQGGTLQGRFTPQVRSPVGRLASGRAVLGMGDAVVLNDPITGQGSNVACRNAAVYLERILARGEAPFDAGWMQESFDAFWKYAGRVTEWTNLMLQPPPPHVQNLLAEAAARPGLRQRFVNGFDDPRDFFPWLTDPERCAEEIASHAVVGPGEVAPD